MKGNAIIESTMLGYEDHGIMTCYINLKQQGSGHGGYGLDGPYNKENKEREPSVLCGFWIKRILETVGVRKWEDLIGKHVRVIGEEFGDIQGIGHIIEDKWFYPKEEIKKFIKITHDWSKFIPCEWIPYAKYFYGKPMYEHWSNVPLGIKHQFPHCITVKDDWKVDFALAWNHHQKISPHHWQYWLITWDTGKTEPLQMPTKYIREMLADWAGAGKAITGKWEYKEWYLKNKEKMILHQGTIDILEGLLEGGSK